MSDAPALSKPEAPDHWKTNSWEDKARENPLFAIQMTGEMFEAPPVDFPPELLASFFAKGRDVWRKHLAPHVDRPSVVFEYGCGAGRVLNAAIEAGHRAIGVDVSPTMIGHCRRLVPQARTEALIDGKAPFEDACADFVFSYAVFQHIDRLSVHLAGLRECARVLKPGGVLALNVTSNDWAGDVVAQNLEHRTLIYALGQDQPAKVYEHHSLAGVRIARSLLESTLAEEGVVIDSWSAHSKAKPWKAWATGRKA
jgi:SAM-dependent methyltransferase